MINNANLLEHKLPERYFITSDFLNNVCFFSKSMFILLMLTNGREKILEYISETE